MLRSVTLSSVHFSDVFLSAGELERWRKWKIMIRRLLISSINLGILYEKSRNLDFLYLVPSRSPNQFSARPARSLGFVCFKAKVLGSNKHKMRSSF